MEYKAGETVEVKTPNGWFAGSVREVLQNYAWTGETRYLVRGPEIETITSNRCIRAKHD